jgi:hypothetical protein
LISSSKKTGQYVGGSAGAVSGLAAAGTAVYFFSAALGPLGIAGVTLGSLVVGAILGGFVGKCNGISASEAYIDEVI